MNYLIELRLFNDLVVPNYGINDNIKRMYICVPIRLPWEWGYKNIKYFPR